MRPIRHSTDHQLCLSALANCHNCQLPTILQCHRFPKFPPGACGIQLKLSMPTVCRLPNSHCSDPSSANHVAGWESRTDAVKSFTLDALEVWDSSLESVGVVEWEPAGRHAGLATSARRQDEGVLQPAGVGAGIMH